MRAPALSGGRRHLAGQHVRAYPGANFTPYQPGKVLPRSAGAVANAIGKLVSLGVAGLATSVLIRVDKRHSLSQKVNDALLIVMLA